MSKRNIEIKVRLNRKEAEALNKRVKKSRLSREAYLRHLISGVVPPVSYTHLTTSQSNGRLSFCSFTPAPIS